jgi:hypothetical protein
VRGTSTKVGGERLVLPGAPEPRDLDLAPFGMTVRTITRTSTHDFVVLARGSDEILLRLPARIPGTDKHQRQRDLVAQAAMCAEWSVLGSGEPLMRAARDVGLLDAAALVPAFCKSIDVAHRIDVWRAASVAMDAAERSAAETQLAAKGCFAGVDLAKYDSGAMAAARLWLDALGRKDVDRIRALSTFPLVIRGLWDFRQDAALAACGGHVSDRSGARDSELEVPDDKAFDKAASCLREGPFLSNYKGKAPELSDGKWPPNRGNAFDGPVGTVLPVDTKRIPRVLRAHARKVQELLGGGALLQAVVTDNDGLTDTFVLVVDTVEGKNLVRAVFGDETFRE